MAGQRFSDARRSAAVPVGRIPMAAGSNRGLHPRRREPADTRPRLSLQGNLCILSIPSEPRMAAHQVRAPPAESGRIPALLVIPDSLCGSVVGDALAEGTDAPGTAGGFRPHLALLVVSVAELGVGVANGRRTIRFRSDRLYAPPVRACMGPDRPAAESLVVNSFSPNHL